MDPFSMAVGCVSLLDVITRLSLSVTDFIVNFRDARADLATVAHELSDLNLNVQILKADTKRKPSYEVPKDLRQYICEVMEHCKTDLTTFETLLKGYENEGLNRVKWAISGRIEAQKIRTSLAAHKAALNLAAETVSLHVIQEIKSDTSVISKDTTLIREYMIGIAKQLEKQDEILKQIAWLRAVVLQKSMAGLDKPFLMEKYFDSLTDYVGSIGGDSVSEDVAREMNLLSLDNYATSTQVLDSEPSTLSLEAIAHTTLVIGNTHRLVAPLHPSSENRHMWTFYVRVSQPERIEEVKIHLHPTFIPSELSFKKPPFTIMRIGWGYFIIRATIILADGYLWEDTNSKYLHLEWELDFDGSGSSLPYYKTVTGLMNIS